MTAVNMTKTERTKCEGRAKLLKRIRVVGRSGRIILYLQEPECMWFNGEHLIVIYYK